ncbi:hypothetical protein BN12_60029 [Nostocoides japonicum T1-X7]|uniref:Uncharacterized protein n=1 Tax=Nostocoides japonicum T1-X7 TaxID=1194083 RepID=A0A077M0K2_9MICO|nr:hypothetical protein BN12_60029 [Tetrasphaera japonica T1-X7]
MGSAGLVPVMRLAGRAGLGDLLSEHVSVDCPNAAAKAGCVVAGMLAGADSIDDLDVLRHGATRRVFTGVRAPSTLGTFLRSFTFGHVRQLDAVASRVLARLAAAVPRLLDGATEPEGMAFMDIDDTIREVHGYAEQGVAYGYSGVKGVNAQVAALSTPVCAPVLTGTRLRKGNTICGHGADKLAAESIAGARRAGVTAQIMIRTDSCYYRQDLVGAVIRAGAWFSVTARMDPAVTKAIAARDADAWTPISYPEAVWEPDPDHPKGGCWISDAEVAQTPFTAFTSHPTRRQVTCRLVVRRVKRRGPKATEGQGQPELFTTWRHHGFITNSTLCTIDADRTHRGPRHHRAGHRRDQERAPATPRPGRSPPTPPGSPSPPSPSTCCAPPASPPPPGTPQPAGPPAHPPDRRTRPGRHLRPTPHPAPIPRLALDQRLGPLWDTATATT